MPAPALVAIITGASDGIGAELARQMARRLGSGGALVLAARNGGKLDDVAAACRTHGAATLVRETDIGVEADCRGLISDTISRFGGIDTLINNAGISGHALFEDVNDLQWYQDVMRVNLWGSVWCTHAAFPYLKASSGRIAAVSSLAGLVGVPGRTAYCSSKFAMTGFFEALRTEASMHGISVTIAYPGVVATEIRRRGFNAIGDAAGKSGLDEQGAMSVEACCRLIDRAVQRRDREVVMTMQGKLARLLKAIAPGYVDARAKAALAKPLGH